MKQVTRSALVSFSAEQMYALVNDVAKYPEFLPGCS
ncbi:ubiquinone-binding protein, partial [Vibrio vulnificus]